MSPYVAIYCEQKRKHDLSWFPWTHNRPWFGKAYARDGVCCFCGKKVSV